MSEPITTFELQQQLVNMARCCSTKMKEAADTLSESPFKNTLMIFAAETENIAQRLDDRINRKDGYVGE